MKSAKLLLALAVALFVAWIGYLAYLVVTTERPSVHLTPFRVTKSPTPVLSRPQLLASDFVVSVEASDSEGTVRPDSIEVVWKKDSIKDGESLKRLVAGAHLELNHCKGFTGPGRYLVPVRQPDDDVLEVTRIPPSPGYPTGRAGPNMPGPADLYPDTAETRAQLQEVPTTGQR